MPEQYTDTGIFEPDCTLEAEGGITGLSVSVQAAGIEAMGLMIELLGEHFELSGITGVVGGLEKIFAAKGIETVGLYSSLLNAAQSYTSICRNASKDIKRMTEIANKTNTLLGTQFKIEQLT